MPDVPFWQRALFWVLWGTISVILTEVVTFSSPFPFFTLWGMLVVFPLYTLHVLVLSWLIFRPKRLSLNMLFLAGALLGMYEAYVTKVLWKPTWGGDAMLTFGGVYVVQTAILVLFYHPWMAFVLPLVIAESLFTKSRETLQCLPACVQRWFQGRTALVASLFGAYCGLFHSLNAPSTGVALASSLSSGMVFWGLVWCWRRTGNDGVHTLRHLLPTNRQAGWLGGLLLFGYLWQGILLRPESMPRTLIPHLTVWGMYLILGGLLYLQLRRAPDLLPGELLTKPPCGLRRTAGLFWLVFVLTSALATVVKPAAGAVVLLSMIAGVSTGVWLVAQAAATLLRPVPSPPPD